MKIHDLLPRSMEGARETKETMVSQAKEQGWSPEIHLVMEGWRGDKPVVMMVPLAQGRDEIMRAGYIMAVFFGCDVIAFSNESWQASSETNPLTGKPWQRDEMQDLVEHHQGKEKGWVTEAILTYVVNRAGDLASGVQPFVLHGDAESGYTVEWGEARMSTEEEALSGGGYIPDKMVEFMNLPTVQQAMAKTGVTHADFGLDAVRGQAHHDCAVMKHMQEWGFQGMAELLSDDPVRSEVIKHSLGEQLEYSKALMERIERGEQI